MRSFSKVEQFLEREPDPAFARRAKIIFQELNLSGDEKVLDVGCGRGFYLNVLSSCWPNLKLHGVDLNERYLSIAKKLLKGTTARFVKADIVKLPFRDNYFDCVIASEILEHVEKDKKALAEIKRVLKPEGILMITVPNSNYPLMWDPLNWLLERLFNTHAPSHIWWLAGIWADHKRLYSEKDIVAKIRELDMRIVKKWKATRYCFPLSHFLLYGVGKNLVEVGFMPGFDRFKKQNERSLLNRILLLPTRIVDGFNKDGNVNPSVNIIIKATKV
jgi:ubiquinone/menaquinone biosynthesis C-methylase UbiE